MGITLLGLVAVMALVVPAEPLSVDQHWSEAMIDMRTSSLTDLALVFNWLGRGLGCLVSLAAVGIVLIARHRWLALLAFGATEALTTLSSTLLKIPPRSRRWRLASALHCWFDSGSTPPRTSSRSLHL